MPKPREDNGPRTRLYNLFVKAHNIDELMETINAWGWADRLFHLHEFHNGWMCMFKLSQEGYERELAHNDQALPVSVQQEARIKELTKKIRELEDELSEARKNNKAPEKGQTSLL